MSKLSASERKKIPTDEFAGPDRSYPIEDRAHAEAAILDAHGPDAALVKRRAEAKLGKHPTRIAIRRASDAVRDK
jgi:hypothetical protein